MSSSFVQRSFNMELAVLRCLVSMLTTNLSMSNLKRLLKTMSFIMKSEEITKQNLDELDCTLICTQLHSRLQCRTFQGYLVLPWTVLNTCKELIKLRKNITINKRFNAIHINRFPINRVSEISYNTWMSVCKLLV